MTDKGETVIENLTPEDSKDSAKEAEARLYEIFSRYTGMKASSGPEGS